VADVTELHAGRASRAGGAVILSIVLYILLLKLMVQVANGVAIEKANRISEVLLAIVRPGPLMFGKVVGVGTAGLVTTLAAAMPVLVKGVAGGDLPPGLGSALLAGSAWFVLGVALYLTIAASLGALIERQEETGSAVAPLNAVILGAYLVGQSAPDTPLGTVLAYVPFTSPIVVPVRLAVGVTSPTEIVASLILGVVAVALAGRFGSVVYRRAIVRTGRRLKVRDVLRQA
jgi:ABC-2 type transport system permease protein